MKLKLIFLGLIFLTTCAFAQKQLKIDSLKNVTEEVDFNGDETINIKPNIIKKEGESKLYLQVYFKNYWTTIDSISFKKDDELNWQIDKKYLKNKKFKARLKLSEIKDKEIVIKWKKQ